MKFTHLLLLALLALGLGACSGRGAQANTNAQPVTTIQNKGSDTMVNLALAWAEAYQAQHPEINFSVTGGGSGTGITALQSQTADIANASRAIKTDEIEAMQEQGFEPVEFVVARDAIAVIVNRTNPVDQLSLQQVSEIFSGKINNWSEVGGDDRPIVRLSRETNSGTHVYFLEEVLRQGDSDSEILFSPDTLLLPSSVGITIETRDNPNAIGYDGLGYISDEVKIIAIAEHEGAPYILPSIETVNDLRYPIARDLYMYTAGEPVGAIRRYLDWILTPEAQQIVKDLGFVPIGP